MPFENVTVTRRVAVIRDSPSVKVCVESKGLGSYEILKEVYDTLTGQWYTYRICLTARDILEIESVIASEELPSIASDPESPLNFFVGGSPMVVLNDATVQLTAQYDEGTKHLNGSPLPDLLFTSVWYQIGAGAPVKSPDQPATVFGGGGHKTVTFVFPAPLGELTGGTFWATETDVKGNQSPASNKVTFSVDRQIPESPLNFSVA